jgi:hypothetical protein
MNFMQKNWQEGSPAAIHFADKGILQRGSKIVWHWRGKNADWFL